MSQKNFSSFGDLETLIAEIVSKISSKVDKVTGKGLSTNDYTTADKNKVNALKSASTKDVPTSGNASSSQVVMGNDSRLTDSRNAKDVYSWAKAATKPTYTANEVGAIPTTQKGTASGVAGLDANGKVPSSQLPTLATVATSGDSADLYYDNTTSGLSATKAQDAIDELVSNFQDGVDAVYDAVVAKGSTPASHSLSDVVDGIASIETSPPTQTKSCTPSTSAQTITPDSGYLLSSVSVGAIVTQEKSCTPSTSSQAITPDSGKYLSKVSVSAISTQTKTVTASRSAQNVTPDSGKYLTKVTINKYPDASGNYTCGSNNGAASSNDMGATNNYRYVNATNVYKKGKSDGAATGTGGATEYWCWANIGYGIQSLQGQGSQTLTVNGWAIITIYDPEGARNAPSWSSGVSVKTVYDVGYLRIYNAYKDGNWTVTLNPTGRNGYATVCPLY